MSAGIALDEILRQSLLSDVIEALDAAEMIHRQLQRSPNGLDAETHRRVAVCAESAYEGLARARQLIEEGS